MRSDGRFAGPVDESEFRETLNQYTQRARPMKPSPSSAFAIALKQARQNYLLKRAISATVASAAMLALWHIPESIDLNLSFFTGLSLIISAVISWVLFFSVELDTKAPSTQVIKSLVKHAAATTAVAEFKAVLMTQDGQGLASQLKAFELKAKAECDLAEENAASQSLRSLMLVEASKSHQS